MPLAGLGYGAGSLRAGPGRAGARRPRAAARGLMAACEAMSQVGRLGGAQPGAPGRVVLRASQRVLSGRRRHLHGAARVAKRARRRPRARARGGHGTRVDLDARHAEQRRRMGQLRSRQRQAMADRGAVRRPQRHDRSQHRRHHGAGARVPGHLPRLRPVAPGRGARRPLPPQGSAARRVMVRPLGREPRLRNLAGAARAQPDRRGHAIATSAPRCALADDAPERGRRMGREHRELRRCCPGRARRLHPQPDGLGADGPDRRRRDRYASCSGRHPLPARPAGRGRHVGAGALDRDRLPQGLLLELPLLPALLPADGARAVRAAVGSVPAG
jgi:hypothetical protein